MMPATLPMHDVGYGITGAGSIELRLSPKLGPDRSPVGRQCPTPSAPRERRSYPRERMPSIRIWATSGRENSGGGSSPRLNISRT